MNIVEKILIGLTILMLVSVGLAAIGSDEKTGIIEEPVVVKETKTAEEQAAFDAYVDELVANYEPLGPEVEVKITRHYIEYDFMTILYSVENICDDDLEYVKVELNMYDINNNLVHTDFTYAFVNEYTLLSGQTCNGKFMLYDTEYSNCDTFELKIVDYDYLY